MVHASAGSQDGCAARQAGSLTGTGKLHRDTLVDTAREVAAFFGRDMAGAVYKAGPIREPAPASS